ncbi:MAG: rod shape-determining protein MreC [Candidatus Falkowbacteria bacterium]
MKKAGTKKIATGAAVIVLLIFLHWIRILAPLESFMSNIFSPLFSGFYSVSSSIRTTYNEQTSKRDLISLIKELENENKELEINNSKLNSLEEENQILREYLKFFKNEDKKYVLANIISRGGLDSYVKQDQTIIIDKGLSDGLSIGLPIISGDGIIVGKIINVESHIAKVYLTSNPACKLAATVQNIYKTSGIVEGKLGLTIEMGYIPQAEEIKEGDIVITSGLEDNIPRGLIIGKVASVKKESNELWQSATIDPIVDFDELIIVSVLIP